MNKYFKFLLSIVKALGPSLLMLGSLMIVVLIIKSYSSTLTNQIPIILQVSEVIMKLNPIIFFATWIYDTIVNYRGLSK